ncbi:MAG TPA: DNA translocase FtsK 4TM domain-containing protein [Opitutaceae bacterium]|nr:DNA translocase FtsK 4TM domain-containing protein [Opitutaceae bacterium]
MPKSASSNPKNTPNFSGPRHRPRWLLAAVCFLLAVLLTVALIDFRPEQSHYMTTNPTDKNLVGAFGAETSRWLLFLIGVSTVMVPLFLFWSAYLSLRSARRLVFTRIAAMILCIATLSGLAAMQTKFLTTPKFFPHGPGGMFGHFIYNGLLRDVFGVFGSGLMLATIYCLSMLFVFTRDIAGEIEHIVHSYNEWREDRTKYRADRAQAKRLSKEAKAKDKNLSIDIRPTPAAAPAPKKLTLPRTGQTNPPFPGGQSKAPFPATEEAKAAEKSEAKEEKKATDKAEPAEKTEAKEDKKSAAAAAGKIALNIVKPEETKKAKATIPQQADDNYQFPPLSLLKEQVKPSAANSEEEHTRNAENLLRILAEFGVDVTLGEIHVGPVITRYEVIPAAGVRVEKIASLDKNIALGMRAQSVRILAPIPGKAAVGVEVPNQTPTPVGLRELIESEDWASFKADLPVALGRDVSGKPLISDLTKMPHLLIAGATGSGKSVCVNSIIASLLYSKTPKDLRLLMVDPKIVELKIFNTLPHMLIPVVTEPKKVPAALKWLLGEMEQRYQIFAKVGVRNIGGFNSRKKAAAPAADAQQQLTGVGADEIEIPDRLPYIVAIIDELADLMMIAPAEIESSIARLAQLTRAAGIHLIIATQRPSVNVITGVIKANLPSRIAFQVASQVDSRTIIDTKGADTLIGRGDMLFSPPGSSRLVRAQGSLVLDDEISSIVEFLKKNGPPQFAQEVQAQIDRDPDAEEEGDVAADGELGDDDELFKQAVDVLKTSRRASTSMLQRRLRIGYNRAARIMEIMEEKGLVGPENGSNPREILADLDKL